MGDQNLYLKVKGKGVQGTQFVECIAKVLNGSNEEIDHPFLVNVADILKSNEEPNFGWYEAIIQITEIEPEGDAHWVLLKTSHSFLVSGDRLLSGEIETNPKTLGKTKVKPKSPSKPVLASGPRPKKVMCDKCHSTIEYLPEHVEEHHGTDYGGGPDGYERVKCPREKCKGYGYIRSW